MHRIIWAAFLILTGCSEPMVAERYPEAESPQIGRYQLVTHAIEGQPVLLDTATGKTFVPVLDDISASIEWTEIQKGDGYATLR